MAHTDFGRSVNPISTRGYRLCPPNYYWHTRIFRPSDSPAYISAAALAFKQSLDSLQAFLEYQKKAVRQFSDRCKFFINLYGLLLKYIRYGTEPLFSFCFVFFFLKNSNGTSIIDVNSEAEGKRNPKKAMKLDFLCV